jgi:hypothetical protein
MLSRCTEIVLTYIHAQAKVMRHADYSIGAMSEAQIFMNSLTKKLIDYDSTYEFVMPDLLCLTVQSDYQMLVSRTCVSPQY